MNFLNYAIVICMALLALNARGFDGDLEKIETINGKLYEKIYILSGDDKGLTFRHEAGIAKVSYAELPMNLRMLFEPAERTDSPEKGEETREEFVPILDFTLRYRFSPVSFPVVSNHCAPALACRGIHWKSHWPGYNPAHRLVDPVCRELALRDFLYTTGLLPAPCGIRPVRVFPRHNSWTYGWQKYSGIPGLAW